MALMGRIHSFESFGTVDGPGIRFVVFMQGCPMRCKYCHNPDTWTLRGGREKTAEEVATEVLKYKSYFAGNGGVTVSGGEPLLQIDFLIELFTLLKKKNMHTCVDTSGICFPLGGNEKYEKFLLLTDLFLLDIKHIDEEAHIGLTGQKNAAPLAFAKYLSDHNKPMWIRHVLVTGYTDDDESLMRLKDFLDTLKTVEKVEVLPYHSMGEVKYEKLNLDYSLKGMKPPSRERVENAKRILGAGKYREQI